MAKEKEAGVEVIRCHHCKTETDHKLLHTEKKEGKYSLNFDYEMQQSGRWSIEFKAFKCVGCRELCIRKTCNDSEADYPNEEFYPPRPGEEARTPPKWIHTLPDDIDMLVEEVFTALQNRSYRLVAMGLRALMDALMNVTIGDCGGFEEKIEEMISEGLLSNVQKEVLEPTLELGHAAIHRGHAPTGNQVDAALGVVMSMLELFFVQKKAVATIVKGIQPRVKVPKPSKAAKAVAAAKPAKVPKAKKTQSATSTPPATAGINRTT